MPESLRFDLTAKDIPTHWYNIQPDFPEPMAPPLNPATKQPATPEMFEAIFPRNLIDQEMSQENRVAIPDEVRAIYALWRPHPLAPSRPLGKGPRYSRPHLLQI
jgi:tryptophan synthase beta chain